MASAHRGASWLLALASCCLARAGQVNVRSFGAVGDGKTDDLPHIEAALATLASSGGGTLYFPSGPGQYAISSALRVSGYGITLRGDGMVSPACRDAGSSLLALSPTNSTLLVLEGCTSCIVEQLGLHGAAAEGGAAACAAESQAAAIAARVRRDSRRAARRGRGVSTSRPPRAAKAAPSTKPVGGAAVTIRGCFQVTLSFLWISDAFAHIALSEMANTVTVTDVQLSNAFGPCAVCAAGAIGPPVGLPNPNTNRTRVDILQVTRLTANNDASGDVFSMA